MAKNKPVEEEIVEKIIKRPLAKAVHDYMMPYSEYIILERALPRVEDGLKPVQRRILFAMHELGIKPDSPFKKSARVVGDCLGKYHPHGDTSIYQAMVNMAQDFNMRNTLVKGHGNFGSVDGDSAAAMRYTEVKLEPLACELLRDLEKETVKWVKNFDDSLEEPDILPGRFPNLLVNGTMGIAIGLATKIPPHNLTEVIDGTVAMIDNPKISLEEMLTHIKGPDFPTGAFIAPGDSFYDIYATGRGRVIMRAKVDIETAERDRQNIVITEFPYNVNKAELQQKILAIRDNLATQKDKNGDKVENALAGIQEILDESDREGIRVVIRLKKGEDAVKILDFLYQKTDLQCNFNVNIVAIADGRPQQLGLLEILSYYIEYQRNIIVKRSQFDLNNAKKREHILDGFVIILPAIDEVIQLIKSSNSRSEARDKLRERFALSERQADAILDLKLVNLTKMEITKIEKELRELKLLIYKLEKILASKKAQLNVVRDELIEIRDKYRSKRLSIIVDGVEDIEHKPYELSKGGGKKGYATIGADGTLKFINVRQFLIADREEPTNAKLVAKAIQFTDSGDQTVIFSDHGFVYRLPAEDIRESRWTDGGERLCDYFAEALSEEKAVAFLKLSEEEGNKEVYLFTEGGMVKKSYLRDYIVSKPRYQGIVLKDNDRLIGVELRKEDASIIFITSDGISLNSEVDDYPLYGRVSGGVKGVGLNAGKKVVFAGQADTEYDEAVGELVLISKKGVAKRVIASQLEPSKRGNKGNKVIDVAEGDLIYAGMVAQPYDIALIDKSGQVKIINTEDIPIDRNRLSKGKPLTLATGSVFAVRHMSDV